MKDGKFDYRIRVGVYKIYYENAENYLKFITKH